MSDELTFEDQSGAGRLTGTLHDPAATVGHVLTVQADHSIAAQAGGVGGGVQVVTVPVSSPQILDLLNTPATLVAVPAGSMAVVVAADILYLAGVTPYTDGGGSIEVMNGQGGDTIHYFNALTTAGFWDQATDQLFPVNATTSGSTYAAASLDGEDVELRYSGGINPTLGDGTLLVTVAYFLAPIA